MDLAIRIGNEYLELNPGTILQMEEESPFLQVSNQMKGEYTMPFSVPASATNMRLLGLPHLHNTKKQTAGFNAIVYINGQQHSRGRVKLETGQGDLNQPANGVINLFYLYGLADFWKSVEGKFLSDCLTSSTFSFPYSQEFDGAGFFAHVTKVLNDAPGSYPYAFLPIANTAGLVTQPDKAGTFILNNVSIFPGQMTIRATPWTAEQSWTAKTFRPDNEICPFPYLHSIIRQVFNNNGYSVNGDILDDPDFKRIVLLHNESIDWLTPSKGPGTLPVVWDMKTMVPRIKVGTFLVGLANRFGWWFDFDYRNRVVSIKHRKNILQERVRRDFTHLAGAKYNFQLNDQGVIYSLVTPGGEDKIPIPNGKLKGTRYNRFQLPVATEAQENEYYFVNGENAYFYCTTDDESGNWKWVKAGDNTFNYRPENSKEEISTNCIVPDTEICPYGLYFWTGGMDQFPKRMILPLVNITGDETETFYIAYNHGVCQSINDKGSNENWPYPLANGGCYDLYGNQVATKALVFEYPDEGTDRGVYKAEWEYFLKLILEQEQVTIPIAFSLSDVLSMEYTDTVVIKGVEYFIKNPKWTLPLTDYTTADLIRLPVQLGI